MRIIGGKWRRRQVLARQGLLTRPITDRAKQSLFDRLTATDRLGRHVLDIFAGTGSLGLEALSRGAEHATFVESDRRCLDLLYRNLAALGCPDQATVIGADALSLGWVKRLGPIPVHLAFCDPPYRTLSPSGRPDRVAALIGALAPAVAPAGWLILRTEARIRPPPCPGWQEPLPVRFGSMAMHWYARVS